MSLRSNLLEYTMNLREVTNKHSIMEREKQVAEKLIGNVKYFYTDQILGVFNQMVQNYGCRKSESIESIKLKLEDMFEGFEPNWASKDAFEWWENLDMSYITLKEETFIGVKSTKFCWKDGCVPPKPLIATD